MSRVLDVYLRGDLAGTLTQNAGGDLEFAYDETWFGKAASGISISLPVSLRIHKGEIVKAYFSGLLPDDIVRERLAQTLGLSADNPFALLEAVGGECAGALALYPHGKKPGEVSDDNEVLTDSRLKEIIELIKRRPMLAGDDGFRLSLPGAQDKLAVGFEDGKVILIRGGEPTTHILKPIIKEFKDTAHNELFCMRLAKRMGLDAPAARLHFADDTPCYLVERYDRSKDEDGRVMRIHQEDFCQALGLPPEIKYQSEGGPSLSACREIISQYSATPAADQIKFLNMVIFNFLIGNADAHGKNFSLLYVKDKPELAPAYDLLSTVVYPDLAEKMAMKIGDKYRPRDVYLRHFHKLVHDTQVAKSAMTRQIHSMTEKIVDTAIDLKSDLHDEGITSDIIEKIIKVIEDRSRQLGV